MKRNYSSSVILILFAIVMILKTSLEIYENRPCILNEKELNDLVMPATSTNNVCTVMNDGDVEVVKSYLRKNLK